MKNRGYTLVELVIAMGIFLVIIMISSYAFQTMLKKSSQQAKSAENQISGIVGLEMMRTDIWHAGFGLFWSPIPSSRYNEVDNSPNTNLGVDATTLNDKVPFAVKTVVSSTTGTDYLVVKSTIVGMNPAARKWSFIQYSSSSNCYIPNINAVAPDTSWSASDQAIVINELFTGPSPTKQLVMNGTAFNYKFPSTAAPWVPDVSFQPTSPTQTFIVYGITNTTLPRMPYNRADYYVDFNAPKPDSCNSQTGVLFKAVADHTGGYAKYPLLDCVGDMQIVYFLDMNDDGDPHTYANGDGSGLSTGEGAALGDVQATIADPALLRSRLKNVMVFILAQDGKIDRSYSYPVSDPNKAIFVGPYYSGSATPSGNATPITGVGKMWTQTALSTKFGTNWNNFHWKIYSFVVNMKNLQ